MEISEITTMKKSSQFQYDLKYGSARAYCGGVFERTTPETIHLITISKRKAKVKKKLT